MRKPSPTSLKVWTVSELLASKSPDAAKIVLDEKRATCTLNFNYPYEVDLDRIKTPRDLLAWVRHLAGKPWMNRERLELFIDAVAKHKGFQVSL